MKREFYFQDDRSNKFWTIEQVGTAYVTTNGRVGATPRETRKQCNTRMMPGVKLKKQIAAKLKKGYVEGIVPQYEKPDWASMSKSEDVFGVSSPFQLEEDRDDEAVIEPAVKALAHMTGDDIEQFEDILHEKLYALDTEAHAREIGEEAYKPGKYFFTGLVPLCTLRRRRKWSRFLRICPG